MNLGLTPITSQIGAALTSALSRNFTRIEQVLNRATGEWHDVADEGLFTSGWVNFNYPAQAKAGYRKESMQKTVRLRGLVKNGTIGNAIFTLPEGYRPPNTLIIATVCDSGFAELRVEDNGQVVPRSPATNTWFSLSGVTFSVS